MRFASAVVPAEARLRDGRLASIRDLPAAGGPPGGAPRRPPVADPRLRADPRQQQRAAATTATATTAATAGVDEAKQEPSVEANGAAPPAKRAAEDTLAGGPTKVIRTSSFQGPELMNGSHGVSMIGDSPDVNGTERRAVAPSRGKMKLTLEGDL